MRLLDQNRHSVKCLESVRATENERDRRVPGQWYGSMVCTFCIHLFVSKGVALRLSFWRSRCALTNSNSAYHVSGSQAFSLKVLDPKSQNLIWTVYGNPDPDWA